MVPAFQYEIIVIGASVGGIHAVSSVLSPLPCNFSVPIVVVQHLGSKIQRESDLPRILARHTPLVVKWAGEGERLTPGVVYIAPQDCHLTINSARCFNLGRGPKRNFVRPSVDVLFESVAGTYRDKVIGVILTGSGCDGAVGGRGINWAGGKLIAQNSATSVNFGMPTALMAATSVDCMLPLDEIAPLLLRWVPQN